MKEVMYMKLSKKMQACFTPHVMMHSLFSLGLGLLLASWFPGLANMWLGLVFMVVGVAWDMMRK
jgi:hypothetical protein